MTRLFIIEDHPVVINGFRNMFRPSRDGIEITGSAGSVKEIPPADDPVLFDLFILDLWLGESDPVENLKSLRERFPEKPVIVYTSEISSFWYRKMVAGGAMGYLIKTGDRKELKSAIETVIAGGTFCSVPFRSVQLPPVLKSPPVLPEGISENHLEILRLVSLGFSHSHIAGKTGTSRMNIARTLSRIRKILGARNNPELIRIAISQGLI
jgi:DNA-binding NarL/FixJ family response regulator